MRAPGRAASCLGEVLGTRAREPWHAPTGLVGCCSKVPKQSVRLRPVSAASQRARILTAWLHLLAGLKDGLRVHRAWAAYPSQALGAAFEINGAHLLQLTCLLSCCLPACAFCTEPSMHTPLCRTQGRLMFVSRRRAAHLSQIKWSLVLAAAYSRAQPCTFGSRLYACVSGPKRSLHGGGGGTWRVGPRLWCWLCRFAVVVHSFVKFELSFACVHFTRRCTHTPSHTLAPVRPSLQSHSNEPA